MQKFIATPPYTGMPSSRAADHSTLTGIVKANLMESYWWCGVCRENRLVIDELEQPAPNTEDLHFPQGYWQNFVTQCVACLWKQSCAYWKNSEHNVVRFINTFAVSIMFGGVFWKIGTTM